MPYARRPPIRGRVDLGLRKRTQEINAEYWDVRVNQSERVAVAQLCLALARAERGTPPVIWDSLGPLNPRQLEVVRLLAAGLRNRDMALALGVSENTIKYHIKNIAQALGAKSRTEIAILAVRKELAGGVIVDRGTTELTAEES